MPTTVTPTAGGTIDGAKVRELRERRKLSREALAVQAGINYSTLVSIEQGRAQDVRVSTLSGLAGALGVSVARLLTEAA